MTALAISSGDPSGIGIEVALKAWVMRHEHALPNFFLIADPDIVKARIRDFNLPVVISDVNEQTLGNNFENTLPVLPLQNKQYDSLGLPDKRNAAGIVEAISKAVELTQQGLASAIVTCPIAKKPLYDAGFQYPGHTEYLAHLAELTLGKPVFPVMMLAGPHLRTVPVTVHIALHRVAEILTKELIIHTARIVLLDLKSRFGILNPKIAFAGLNPHAGEDGAMGQEELDIIIPAIEKLHSEGFEVIGPLPSDTMFHDRARKNYDAALCMYHDQALIPVKTIGFDDTVNVTLGLPFIRTSPDHGTAFDIAKQGVASPQSFIAAVKLADKLVKNSDKNAN